MVRLRGTRQPVSAHAADLAGGTLEPAADEMLSAGRSSALEKRRKREDLDETPPSELRGLVRNLNCCCISERERYTRYQRTLSDRTHGLKTPLAVLPEYPLRSLRGGKI